MHRAGHCDVALGRMSGLCPDHIRQAYMLVHAKHTAGGALCYPCAIPGLSCAAVQLQPDLLHKIPCISHCQYL